MNPPHVTDQVWTRYVAIGDSFTEGLCDSDPNRPGSYIGWADRLARHLDALAAAQHLPFGYANLAVRGRRVDDVVGPQLDAALALGPDLVSMIAGGNDILRPSVDLDRLAARLEEAVVRIRHTGADVLLGTPTDTRAAGVFRALRGRHAVASANVFSIAERHGCHVLNLWGMTALQDWRMWDEDRIHLTSQGHRRVAEAACAALGHDLGSGDWAVPLGPVGSALPRRERWQADVAWARAHLAPWLRRRATGTSSGDGIAAKRPELTSFRDRDAPPRPRPLPDH